MANSVTVMLYMQVGKRPDRVVTFPVRADNLNDLQICWSLHPCLSPPSPQPPSVGHYLITQ